MHLIGNFLLILAVAFGTLAIVASWLGIRLRRQDLIDTGRRATYAVVWCVVGASASLIYLLATTQLQYEYVAANTNRHLPMFYKITSFWAGQAGSLLLWSLVLALYMFAVTFRYRNKNGEWMPYVIVSLMITQVFFLALNIWSANPFKELIAVYGDGTRDVFTPVDGRGLNPLLQHPAMIIHPPTLYIGYVGFVVPFAFAVAALLANRLDDQWIKISRRWTLFAWLFQSAGIMLGGLWAYVELGWGGYWAWDPVENASLMPWLTGTAFLHSVMIQEKRNMFKVWNVSLIIATYLLCIFGTFLTRSGVVSSVHSFAQGSIGIFFASYIVLALVATTALVIRRLPQLRSENRLDSPISRESSFLFNNLILLIACFAVLWGTIFPIISEAVTGEKIVVGAPFFNKVNIPIALILLFLTGAGPLFAWRKTSAAGLTKAFLWPSVAGLLVGIVFAIWITQHFYAVISFALSGFVMTAITMEFVKGARSRMSTRKENPLVAVKNLTLKNKRRYGGYIVHVAIVIIFVGITGTVFNYETKRELGEGESTDIKNYRLVCERVGFEDTPNYQTSFAELTVYKDGHVLTSMKPEYRMYKTSEQPTTEVALHKGLDEDLYVVFTGLTETGNRAILQVYVNPLVTWLWIGTLVLIAGTLITLLPNPDERESESPRKSKPQEHHAAVHHS